MWAGGLRARRGGWLAALMAVVMSVALAGCINPVQGPPTPASTKPIPRFQHVFLIVMENSDYDDIIGSRETPKLNTLAKTYGLATNYWAVTHPSEPNYVAMIGGALYGISDDASYTVHPISSPYLGSQLEDLRMTWKSYQQGLPSPGFKGETANSTSGAYASKHNPFMNFLSYYPANQQPTELANVVPITQLTTDLASGDTPNFSFIVPGLCDDMHGDSSCGSANLRTAGDTYANDLVTRIMGSSVWQQGNNAIIITWDESTLTPTFGPNNLVADGGHVPTIVITNNGPRGVKDNYPYDHYSLLRTIQSAFGLGCLQESCHATQMAPLFTK